MSSTDYTIEINITAPNEEAASKVCEELFYAHGTIQMPDGVEFDGAGLHQDDERVAKRVEAIYDVLNSSCFEEFMSEDGSFNQHIRGDEGAPSKKDILEKIALHFKKVVLEA